MIRATLYLVAAALVWFAEGFLFSRFLDFSPWQTAVLAVFYIALFAVALRVLLRTLRDSGFAPEDIARWRALSLAPMIAVILGSFLSLPLVLAVLALGRAF